MVIKYSKEVRLADSFEVNIIAEATSIELDNVTTFLEEVSYNNVCLSIVDPNSAHREEVLWMYFHNDSEEVEMSKSLLDIEEELGGEVAAGVNSILMVLGNPTVITV